MFMKIEVVGSIDGHQYYDAQQIRNLLANEHIELSYGADFMGRPGTGLYAGETEIIKLRLDLDLKEDKAHGFLNHTLSQEQRIKTYHPKKTWFLVELEEQKFKLGNICPRLTPIHTLATQTPEDKDKLFDIIKKIYHSYLSVARQFNLRLDEGLSNFGIDENNQLFYLDDDIYSWDKFISFSHLLGVLIRNNTWLNEAYALDLGRMLQQTISELFEDSHTNYMVARHLRDIFMPDNDRKVVLETIIGQLEQQKVIHKQLPPLINHPITPKPEIIATSSKIETAQPKVQPALTTKNSSDYLAIISDIHANLPALEAVLDYLAAENIYQGIVLGDVIGYGPHPAECIERLQQTNLTVIKGNHDHAAVTGDTKRGMSSTARWCIEWSIPRLKSQHLQWLSDLPLELSSSNNASKNWRAMHGAPIDPNYFYAYVYQMTYEQNLEVMAKRKMDYCFHGHSHVQGLYVRDVLGKDYFVKPQPEINLTQYKHALICSGAVGQPRDGCKGAQFALYNQRTHQLKFIVVDYDMNKTIADLRKYDFPESLPKRLQAGA